MNSNCDDKRKLKMPSKKQVRGFSFDLFFLVFACCCGSFSTVAVMIPNGLTTGGLTGIVRLLSVLIPVKFSVLYYCSSLIIVLMVLIFLGWIETRKILLLSFLYPGILFLFEHLNISFLERRDILLAAIFCGIFQGVCTGVVLNRGYVFSGTAAIGKILRKKLFPQIPQSKIMLILDAIVISFAALIFGRNIALYALITQYIVWKTTDAVIFGFEGKIVQLEIITHDEAGPLINYIIKDLHRGVSSEKVIGEYTKERFTKLRLLCSPREMIRMKRKIYKIDPKALVTVIQLENVWGKGFKNLGEDK